MPIYALLNPCLVVMCLWSALVWVGWGCVVVGSDSFERLNVIDPAMGFVMVKLVDVTLLRWLPFGVVVVGDIFQRRV
jgi:hypothetical protein